MEGSQKIKISMIGSGQPTFGYLSEEKNLHPHVRCSIIYDIQDVETP